MTESAISETTGAGVPAAQTGKSELDWAFEIHKNCDQMLHQRLSAFTALQAFAIAAYIGLTIARFQLNVPPNRIPFFEVGRYAIGVFGISVAVFGWMVTFPMLVRLQYLNKQYLNHSPVYKDYIDTAIEEGQYEIFNGRLSGWNRYVPAIWRNYKEIIPFWLPVSEILLWVVLLVNMSAAIVFSGEDTLRCDKLLYRLGDVAVCTISPN